MADESAPFGVRDVYVAAIMTGLISRPESTEMLRPDRVEQLATVAFGIADAMMAKRDIRWPRGTNDD